MRKSLSIASLAAAVAVSVTGCSSVEASSTQKALHFKGGYGQDPEFSKCVDPSNKEYDGPGDTHYVYQMDLRSYDATGGPASEADPIEVLDKNGETLRVPMTVTFYLKPGCKNLLDFHNTVGDKYDAYNDTEGENAGNPGGGWLDLLDFAVGEPSDVQLDLIAKRYSREQLRNSEDVRATLETALIEELPGLIKKKTGGKQFFERFAISVKQPETTNEALVASIAEAAAAKEQGKTAEAKARAEGAAQVAKAQARKDAALKAAEAAEAEVRVARAEAAKQAATIAGQGGVDAATERYIADKGLNPRQPTIVYGVPGAPAPAPTPSPAG